MTERLVRPATLEDAEAVAAVYAPYVLETCVSFEEEPPDAGEVRRRMGGDHPWLVCQRGGEVTGFAYASRHRERAAYRWSVEVSVYLRADEQGRGTGRALYDVLLPALREAGYANALAGIALPNDASVALHEAVGFRHLGTFARVGHKLGRWVDVGWWQLRLR